jgi:uncharacterized protein YehS (DUF1456 family)
MNNNDILRRLRYSLELNDLIMIDIFGLVDHPVTRDQIRNWLKKEEDEGFEAVNDKLLATFLNGVIVHKRGKRDGETPKPEQRLSNNIIFMKLKIALNLKAEDILELLKLADFVISKHELSAFFRRKDHKHYRECKDQVLRYFIQGIQFKYRDKKELKSAFQWKTPE